ncbi:MAG: glutathione S-transferase family protein [Gammaproteobacteria bacterium]|nr:glutathione S-transferase family protein [Gammaproteobacteria bacterium]
MSLKLISFELCPFVQRSVITLLEKNIDFEISYLTLDELKNPPEWFRQISPLGKVPVLRVDDTTLFESTVIMEYIDETSAPSLHPADPLQRALNRAWMAFGGDLLFAHYRYATAADKETFEASRQELKDSLLKLEPMVKGPFFNGESFNLIDAAFASLFMRMDILESQHSSGFYADTPNIAAWAAALAERDTVRNSVVPDLAQKYIDYCCNAGEFARSVFSVSMETV